MKTLLRQKKLLTVLDFTIEWFQNHEEYHSLPKYFYTLMDENGANSVESFYKFTEGLKFIYDDYLFEVTNDGDDRNIICERQYISDDPAIPKLIKA